MIFILYLLNYFTSFSDNYKAPKFKNQTHRKNTMFAIVVYPYIYFLKNQIIVNQIIKKKISLQNRVGGYVQPCTKGENSII